MTARDVVDHLGLIPLPEEGGFYRQTWKSTFGTAIYFLLTPEPNGFSALHKLNSCEIYHFYRGDGVSLHLFPPDAPPTEIRLGSDLKNGEIPQYVVPAETIQGSRLVDGGEWALLGTTMAPGFSDEGFELLKRSVMVERYPGFRDSIIALTRESD